MCLPPDITCRKVLPLAPPFSAWNDPTSNHRLNRRNIYGNQPSAPPRSRGSSRRRYRSGHRKSEGAISGCATANECRVRGGAERQSTGDGPTRSRPFSSCCPDRSLRAAGQRNVNRLPSAHPVADEAKLAVIKAPDELVRGLHHKLITVFD